MPPLPPVANTLRCVLKGTNQNAAWNIILFLQYVGTAPSVADLQTVANQIATAWSANIAALCNTGVILSEISIADLTSTTASSGDFTVADVFGTRVGVAMTVQVATVASWQVNMRFRGGHFRSYLPAAVLGDVQNGRLWMDAFRSAAAVALEAFRVALNAIATGSTTYKVVGVSFRTANAPRPQPLVLTFNGVAVHPRVDTQRRRLGAETT